MVGGLPCVSTACGYEVVPNPWCIHHRSHRWQNFLSLPGPDPAGQAWRGQLSWWREMTSWSSCGRGCSSRAVEWWRYSENWSSPLLSDPSSGILQGLVARNNQCRAQNYVTSEEELCVQLSGDVHQSRTVCISGLVNCLYSLDLRTFPQIRSIIKAEWLRRITVKFDNIVFCIYYDCQILTVSSQYRLSCNHTL